MKAGQGKNKGSGFEREVGVAISRWLSNNQRSDLICRTVGSGAQFTFTKGSGNPGDLMAQHPIAFKFFEKFVVECKSWKDIQFQRFLEREGDLFSAAIKVSKEAGSNKHWWLVTKQNHRKTIILMPYSAAVEFITRSPVKLEYHMLFSGDLAMFYMEEFFKSVSPECVL